MPDKSLLRITRPRETYVDGYGVERTFDEPKVVTKGRKVWDAGKRFLEFLEGDKTWTAPDGEQYPIRQGAGIFEVFDPNPTGKVDDIIKLANNLDAIKNTYRKAMLSIKNRRRAWWHEVNAAMNNKRVGGMNYAGDLIDRVPGTIATNKAAARYNAALKAGDSEKAYAARREVEKLTRRDFYDPYVNTGYYREVEDILNSPYNGGAIKRYDFTPQPYPQPTQPKQVGPDFYKPDGSPGYYEIEWRRDYTDELPW